MKFRTDSRSKYIARVVKSYDPSLTAFRMSSGAVGVYKTSKKFDAFYEDEETKYMILKDVLNFVFALTENWSMHGLPVDWGTDIVLERLKKIDSWNNKRLMDDFEEKERLAKESKQKDMNNQNEAWLYENREKFKKDFSYIRTCNMDKTEKRRINKEKSLEIKS